MNVNEAGDKGRVVVEDPLGRQQGKEEEQVSHCVVMRH